MNRRYLSAVEPLPDHILQVDFVSGSRLLLDMKPYLDKTRFRSLSDPLVWSSAVSRRDRYFFRVFIAASLPAAYVLW